MSTQARKRPRGHEFIAALSLTLARLCFGTALILGTIASYAWWGSTGSRLGLLWKPAAVAAVIWLMLLVAHRLALRRIQHWHRASQSAQRQKSRTEIPKPSLPAENNSAKPAEDSQSPRNGDA